MKNYTTKIDSRTTVNEIEEILAKHGAVGVHKSFNPIDATIDAVMFSIDTDRGPTVFKLPCEYKKLHKKLRELRRSGKVTRITWKSLENFEHAKNVAWRIIKDWVDAQLALISIEMVSLDQVFLPYAYSMEKQKTLYEMVKEDGFKLLLEGAE